MFDKQKVFDTVVAHLRKQQTISRFENGKGCAYRGPNGTSCAVGCLIPDELYSATIEELGCPNGKDDVVPYGVAEGEEGYDEYVKRKTKLRDLVVAATGAHDEEDFLFLRRLQRIHDRHCVDEWESEFQATAAISGVVYSPKT
jgi:hypothetical protein